MYEPKPKGDLPATSKQLDDTSDLLQQRFNTLEQRLESIEKSVTNIAVMLREQLPPPGAADDLATELTMERGNRRAIETRVDELEAQLHAIKRALGITIR